MPSTIAIRIQAAGGILLVMRGSSLGDAAIIAKCARRGCAGAPPEPKKWMAEGRLPPNVVAISARRPVTEVTNPTRAPPRSFEPGRRGAYTGTPQPAHVAM